MHLTSRRHSFDVYRLASRRVPSTRIESCHKLLLSALVILLGAAASGLWSPVLSWPSLHGEGITVLKGRVLYIDYRDTDGKPVYVIAKREDKNAEPISIPVDDEGAFEDELSPGVYSIYIKGVKDPTAEAAKYEVVARKETTVDLNWTDHLVYCTDSNERVISTGLAKSTKLLHRPKYELIKFDNKPLNAVIEYCGIKPEGKYWTDYKSVRLISGATKVFADNLRVLFADDVRLNAQIHDVQVSDKEVIVEQHGTEVIVKHDERTDARDVPWWTIGHLRGGPHFPIGLSITGGGSIKKPGKTLQFSIDTESSSFTFNDGSGLELKSTREDCSLIVKESKKPGTPITFTGSGTVTGTGPYLRNRPTPLRVEFSVTLVDNGRNSVARDSFAIRIHDLKGYRNDGLLTSGDIQVINTTPPSIGISRVFRKK